MKYVQKYYALICIIIFYLLLSYYCRSFFFFGDNVALVSRIAWYFTDNNFSSFILPSLIDSGHPPFYGAYLALCWKIFGTSLLVSHVAMLPFKILAALAYLQIIKLVVPKNLIPYALLLYLIEPTVLTQSAIDSLDVVLLCFHLWAIYAIIKQKKILLSITLIFLSAISLRGAIAVFTLFIAQQVILIFQIKQTNKSLINNYKSFLGLLIPFIPVILLNFVWYYYHFIHSGFLLQNNNSAWNEQYRLASAKEFLWNIAIICWRFLDFGRIFIVSFLLFSVYKIFNSKNNLTNNLNPNEVILWILLIIPLSFYIPLVSIRINPILHRYFMTYYVLILIICVINIPKFFSLKTQKIILTILIVAVFSGNWWIYPDNIAKGWEACFAVTPYFEMQNKMNKYIDSIHLNRKLIGTEFPAAQSEHLTHLNNNLISYSDKDILGFDNYDYILQSNIMNDFTDQQLILLKSNYQLIYELKKQGVYLRLYKKLN